MHLQGDPDASQTGAKGASTNSTASVILTFKIMNFAFKITDFGFKIMNFAFRITKFAFKNDGFQGVDAPTTAFILAVTSAPHVAAVRLMPTKHDVFTLEMTVFC